MNVDTKPVLDTVVGRVVRGQLLWTAGHTLTTSGFLLYFARELGAATGRDRDTMNLVIAFLLAVPETVGVAAMLTRSIVRRCGGRKPVYVGGTLLSRLVAIGIPLLAFPALRPAGLDPLWTMIALLAVAEAVQSVAYVAYVSWLSDLVPEARWGRFFAIRNVAKIGVLLIVPTLGGFVRDWWRRGLPERVVEFFGLSPDGAWASGLSDSGSLIAYVATFGLGTLLTAISILPMLSLPDLPVADEKRATDETRPTSAWHRLRDAFANRSLRFLLIHQWWLAAANGLTQAAFFGFLFGRLHVGLGVFYLFYSTMRVVKLPVSVWAGRLCDGGHAKTTLLWSLVVAAMAMPVWFVSTPATWWLLFVAFGLWGSYAAANVAGRNLLLELAPRSDNALHLALFRQVAGMLAGLTGLLGGLWLDALARDEFTWTLGDRTLEGFHLLFAISFAGRLTAVLWLLPVEEPRRSEEVG